MAPIGTSNFDLPFVPLITCPILTIPSLQVKKDKTDNKLIVKFRLESVGDDLRAGEGAARCAVFLPFARPVGLSNYKAKLLDSCLSLPLLNICPPHLKVKYIIEITVTKFDKIDLIYQNYIQI